MKRKQQEKVKWEQRKDGFGHPSPPETLGPCHGVLVLNLFAARGMICGKWGRAALATSPSRTGAAGGMDFCCLGQKFTQNTAEREALLLFQPELLQNLSGFLLERTWGSPGHPVSEGCPSRVCSPPVHPAGVELGFAVGTSMGKRGTATPQCPWAGLSMGTKSIMFSTGGEGDREQEPGEGEVSPSFLLPEWGLPGAALLSQQHQLCLGHNVSSGTGLAPHCWDGPLLLGEREGSAQGGGWVKM